MAFTNTADTIGDEILTDSIIDKTVTEYLDNNVQKVGKYAFYKCENLETVNCPNVTSLGHWAFSDCSKLASISFPALTHLSYANYTFQNCVALTEASFPELTKLGYSVDDVFRNCTALKTLSFPKLTNLKNAMFYGCDALTELNDEQFPSLTTIEGGYVFSDCTGIKEINLSNLTTLSDGYNFSSCDALEKVTLPKVTSFGSSEFAHCTNLKTIDCSITSVSNSAFRTCKSLTAVILRNPDAVCTCDADTFTTTNVEDSMSAIDKGICYFYVPADLYDSYISDTFWSQYADNIRAIEDYEAEFENDVITDTWEEIASYCNDGGFVMRYSIGQTKDVTLTYEDGTFETITMEIADFYHDDLADGSGKAPITWIAKNALSTAQKIGGSANKGWETANIRTWCNSDLFTSLSSDLQSIIKDVNKISDGGYRNKTLITTVDKVWIPSYDEVVYTKNSDYSSVNTNGSYSNVIGQGYKYSIFDTSIKRYNVDLTSSVNWWLRSFNVKTAYECLYVTSDGTISNSNVGFPKYVIFGFCT